MKYALIVMFAVYLVTFGCNPKAEEEENTATHDKVEHTVVADATTPEELTIATHTAAQSTPEAGPSNQYGTANHKAPVTPADVEITTEEVKTEATPADTKESVAEDKVAPQVEDEGAPASETTNTESNQWQSIAQSAASTVLALMHEEQNSNPAQAAETPAVEKESVTVLPCGKQVPQGFDAQHSPCAKHSKYAPQTAVPAAQPELSQAMQKMVNATNDMVTVTRQLVIATQQMLAASKDVAVEVIDSGKEAIEKSKPAVQNAVNEAEIIETVKEVVSATKEAFEATSDALSKALETKEAEVAPEIAPEVTPEVAAEVTPEVAPETAPQQ